MTQCETSRPAMVAYKKITSDYNSKNNTKITQTIPAINSLTAQQLLVHRAFHDTWHYHQRDSLLPRHTGPTTQYTAM